jgi:ribosomal protein S18 acetylase RimI-like enzyme
MEEYRNVLANKFMRDTNYIIIKDTDDLEELERQWELFRSCLTVRQQRLSDDRSLQIWNMTNQQHYEYQKTKLMDELRNKLDIENEEPISIEYEPEEDDDERIDDDEITNFVNMSFDDFEIPDDENNINEPIKEDSIIPTDGKELNEKQKLNDEIKADMNKDAQADQYEIDSNINIIGSIKGFTPQERLDNLEKAFRDWNSQNQDHRKKSDDKCREIYGMSNIDRYNKIKGSITKTLKPEKDDVKGNSNTSTTNDIKSLGEFVSMVYSNMQVVNESESNANKQHRRLNDTPYFTPSEMIDMGVHGNDNYYCPVADNDGLITNIRIPTWFSSYKDMCMDHIFEDYTKDWIDTLDHLYSDFEQIKESGDENKIAARKQSILDLGWNPEIPFTRRNRQLASKRVSKLLDKSSPLNIFINLDKEVPDSDVTDEPVVENAHKNTHQPVYIVFVQGSKGLLVPDAIRAFTNSDYTHVGMSFDSSLKDIHTYNITANPGIVRETLSRYQDNVISVMAFFAPTEIYNNMKDEVMDHYINARKSIYDLTAIANKVVKKNTRLINNKYHQICSTFVDTILRSGQIDITKDNNLPDPGQLYNITKSMPNKIIEVYNGPASGYNAEEVNKKMNKLLKDGIKAIDESKLTDKIKSKKADMDLELTAKTYDALSHLTRDEKTKADMKKKANTARSMKGLLDFNEASLPKGITLRQATTADTDNMIEWELDSVDKSVKNDSKVINYIKQDVKKSIKDTKMIMDGSKTIGMLTTCPIDNGEWWYIGEIYLIPEYRDKGIGSELLKEQIQNHDRIKLQVGYSNNKAKRLYESLGFKVIDKNDNGRFYLMALDKTDSVNEGISDLDSAESNDIYHNIEDWESGKSNVLWVTGLSGSGKSTISKEISAKYNDVEYVELDLIQAGKIKQWDDNDKRLNGLLKDFVDYKGGFDNIFPLYTEKARKGELNFGDMMDKSCADQFNELFKYIITYTKKNSNRRFVIEGVQIAMCTSDKMIDKISKYPVIIKMNGPLKTEFRREKRSIKSHIDQDMDFITTFKHVCHHIQTWVKNGFFLNNWKELNYFRTHIGESASILNEVKQFPVEFDQDGNLIIYKARIGSIAYGDEIDDSVKLLESYRNTNNIEGMKYELAKLWFINDSIEKKLKKKLTNDQYKELINHRATCLNVFKLNLEYVMKAEKGFNFSDYYNSTPFSDNSVKITANTLKYSMKAIASMI